MNIKKWLSKNTSDLTGKVVAITGATGGLGKEICKHLISLNAELILLDRNEEKDKALIAELTATYPNAKISYITTDLEDKFSVDRAIEKLKTIKLDYLIHNAGIYNVPLKKTNFGYNNVFTVNFVAHYYITKQLLDNLKQTNGKVIAVGSIAHNYSKIDESDIDFSTRKKSSKIYGNSKRYLMFALSELFKREQGVKFTIAHPGITFTNITSHYPKFIFALIKHPMKVIFISPKKASLSIIKAIFDEDKTQSTQTLNENKTPKPNLQNTNRNVGYFWIGPKIFNIWGYPSKKKLNTAKQNEIDIIFKNAEDIYKTLTEKN